VYKFIVRCSINAWDRLPLAVKKHPGGRYR
jgi:hypothetical protein